MVRWHEHAYPHPLARWHTHPEVEIHLIRAGTGLAFVGDHVGRFEAGHLALVGSHLPHNWISDLSPGSRYPGVTSCSRSIPTVCVACPRWHRRPWRRSDWSSPPIGEWSTSGQRRRPGRASLSWSEGPPGSSACTTCFTCSP
nr:AraC family ligand binding domain-containing protein [Tessaracoccus coleopterorum]